VITGVSYWRQNSGLFLYMQGKWVDGYVYEWISVWNGASFYRKLIWQHHALRTSSWLFLFKFLFAQMPESLLFLQSSCTHYLFSQSFIPFLVKLQTNCLQWMAQLLLN
jgi:hypothetical protein